MNKSRKPSEQGAFARSVVDRLGPIGRVRSRAMFGGFGIWRASTFFAIVFRDRLYFKVSDATRPKYEEAGSEPFRPGRRQTMRGYYEVPAAVFADTQLLQKWALGAVAASGGRTARQRKPKRLH